MPQRDFYIDEEKQLYLSASWKKDWSRFELRFQEEVICSFTTRRELTSGRQFVMPDGHLLSVRLKVGLHPELELLLDGLPLTAKPEAPGKNKRTILQLALFLAVLNISAGTVAVVTQSDTMLSIGLGYGSIAVGGAYLLLAWGSRKLASFAVYALVALVSLDLVLLFLLTAMREGPSSPVSGLLIKLFLIYAFIRGTRAMKQIRSKNAATVP